MKNTKKHVTKYTIVGISIALFNFCTYTLIARVFINNNDFLFVSSIISTSLSVILAYILHSKITWKERKPTKKGIAGFFIWNAFCALVVGPVMTWFFGLFKWLYEFGYNLCNAIHIPLDYNFIESTGIFVLVSIVSMILNYLFYDKFVFNEKDQEK